VYFLPLFGGVKTTKYEERKSIVRMSKAYPRNGRLWVEPAVLHQKYKRKIHCVRIPNKGLGTQKIGCLFL
jgi:hypothetical protein